MISNMLGKQVQPQGNQHWSHSNRTKHTWTLSVLCYEVKQGPQSLQDVKWWYEWLLVHHIKTLTVNLHLHDILKMRKEQTETRNLTTYHTEKTTDKDKCVCTIASSRKCKFKLVQDRYKNYFSISSIRTMNAQNKNNGRTISKYDYTYIHIKSKWILTLKKLCLHNYH